jgi:hypothetical protein
MKNILIPIIALISVFSFYLPYKTVGAVILGCGASNANLSEPCAEQYCRLKFSNSVLDSLSSDGQATCKCKDTYQWNSDETACEKSMEPSILIPPTPQTRCAELEESFTENNLSYNGYIRSKLSNNCAGEIPVRPEDQTCQRHYGPYSAWNGQRNENDGPICDCMTGYRYESSQNTCSLIPVPVVEISDETQAPSIVIEEPEEVPQPQRVINAPVKRLEKAEPQVIATTTDVLATSSISTTTQKEVPVRQGFWSRVLRWFRL